MKSFGDSLKQAREERGVTLDAIAQNTRISRRYLVALERSDLETLPGGAFDQGYIRTYSEFLGIDAGPILEAYKARERELGRGTAESDQQQLAELSRLLERRSAGRSRYSRLTRRGGPILALAAVLGLMAAGTWLVMRESLPADPAAADARTPEPKKTRIAPPVPAEPDTRPTPQAKAPPTPTEEATGFVVANYGVGTGVVDRQLVGRDDQFSEGTEVWFWTRVVGGEPGEVVRHIWMHDGRVTMASELKLGGPHWRTYSRLTLPPGGAGAWSVEARAGDGRRLAREEFVCIE